MKSNLIPLSAATALLAFSGVIGVHAQTTTTVTVEPTPARAIPPNQVIVVQPTPTAIVPQPGQHVAEITLSVSRGSVQAYFGSAARGEKVEIGSAEFNVKLPSRSTVTKLANRDDDSGGSKHITADNPWHVVVPFNGPGRYVFNISDWDNDPVVTVAEIKVDGAIVFSGHGSEDDFNGWAQKTYGANVKKTGSREVAFILTE